MALFYGAHRGIVVDDKDPEKRGRLRVRLPGLPIPTMWAAACLAPGSKYRPRIDQEVWILFEKGDMRFPVYIGVAVEPPRPASPAARPRRRNAARTGRRRRTR